MSFKYERDTYQGAGAPGAGVPGVGNLPGAQTLGGAVGAAAEALRDGRPIPGTTGHHPFAEKVGTALTGGRQDAGAKGYLAVSSHQLPRAFSMASIVSMTDRVRCRPTSNNSNQTLSGQRC
jgi:hypothetical protein